MTHLRTNVSVAVPVSCHCEKMPDGGGFITIRSGDVCIALHFASDAERAELARVIGEALR